MTQEIQDLKRKLFDWICQWWIEMEKEGEIWQIKKSGIVSDSSSFFIKDDQVYIGRGAEKWPKEEDAKSCHLSFCGWMGLPKIKNVSVFKIKTFCCLSLTIWWVTVGRPSRCSPKKWQLAPAVAFLLERPPGGNKEKIYKYKNKFKQTKLKTKTTNQSSDS